MTFIVWHAITPRFMDAARERLAAFPTGFTKVATVETDHVGRVFELTNHINASWTDNDGVIAEPGRHRSTSVGDVITGDGARWAVDGIGLREF